MGPHKREIFLTNFKMKLGSILAAFAVFESSSACYSFQSTLDDTINVVEDTMEILVLGRYFLRDTESYGRALFDNFQRFYVDCVVDYIDDISENACNIQLLDPVGQDVTEFIYDVVPQLDPWQPGNFTLTPCAFNRDVIMAQASVVVDVQEWIEANFQFFELFWETYGRFL